MAYNKGNYDGIPIRGVYYKEFDLIHDKVINMYKMMQECNINRLFFKIKKSQTKVVTVRIFRYKKSTDIFVNTIEERQDKIYDYVDTYKFFTDEILVREGTKLFTHNLKDEKKLISTWMD